MNLNTQYKYEEQTNIYQTSKQMFSIDALISICKSYIPHNKQSHIQFNEFEMCVVDTLDRT